MVHRKLSRPAAPPAERRSGRDRRQADKGPPGGRDRRVGLEPRRPEVVELEVSVSEWMALQEATTAPLPTSPAEAPTAAPGGDPARPVPPEAPAASVPAQPADPTRTPGAGRVR